MKMIVAIIDDNHSEHISATLVSNNFRVTRLASTGGFLREGETTLMVGVDDEQVESALQIFRDFFPPAPEKLQATLYVLNVKSFDRV